MSRSVEQILKEGEFDWQRVFGNARRYITDSWLILVVVTAAWYVLPHPLLLSLPEPGEAEVSGGLLVWLLGSGIVWFLASAGIRLSFARFAGVRPDLSGSGSNAAGNSRESSANPDDTGQMQHDPDAQRDASRLILRYAGMLLYVGLVMAAFAVVVLVLLGLMILPASRVDGVALYSAYVAPATLAVVLVLLRIRYAVSIETVLQHGDGVRQGVRRGLAVFRERRLVVVGMTALVYLFWIPELLVEGLTGGEPALTEVARVVSAAIRSAALVIWLSWYHEARRTAAEEIE